MSLLSCHVTAAGSIEDSKSLVCKTVRYRSPSSCKMTSNEIFTIPEKRWMPTTRPYVKPIRRCWEINAPSTQTGTGGELGGGGAWGVPGASPLAAICAESATHEPCNPPDSNGLDQACPATQHSHRTPAIQLQTQEQERAGSGREQGAGSRQQAAAGSDRERTYAYTHTHNMSLQERTLSGY